MKRPLVPRASRRSKQFPAKLVLLVVSCAFGLFLGEVTLRLFGFYGNKVGKIEHAYPVDDDVLDHRLRPNQTLVHEGILVQTNSKGWRDYEYDYTKPDGVVRLVAVGDSVLNGHGVRMEDVFAKELERLLNRNAEHKSEVIMLSIGALDTVQEAHLLEIEGLKYNPDVVVVGYVLNDPGGGHSLKRGSAQRAKESRFFHFKQALKRSSLIFYGYRAIDNLGWKLGWQFSGSAQGEARVQEDYYRKIHEDEESWGPIVQSFEKMQRLCEPGGIPVVLVIFPILYQLEDYPWLDVHRKVTDSARAHGFEVLDLLHAYETQDQKSVRLGWGDYTHPNALGHRVAGQALYSFLIERELLPH